MTRAAEREARRVALDRARDLVASGASLSEAARAVGVGLNVIKKASAKGRWVRERGPGPDREPVDFSAPEAGGSLARAARGALLQILAEPGRARVPDLVALEEWARKDEERARARATAGVLEGWPDEYLDAVAALQDQDPAAAIAALRVLVPEPEGDDHEAEVEALRTERDQARDQAAEARAEVAVLQGEVEAARRELDVEVSRVRGLEALLAGRPA